MRSQLVFFCKFIDPFKEFIVVEPFFVVLITQFYESINIPFFDELQNWCFPFKHSISGHHFYFVSSKICFQLIKLA